MVTTFALLALIWPLLWVIRLLFVTRRLMGMQFQPLVLAFNSATSRLYDVEYDGRDLEWRVLSEPLK